MRPRIAVAVVVTLVAGLAVVTHVGARDSSDSPVHREAETPAGGPADASRDAGGDAVSLPEQADERAVVATESGECVHPYPCGDEWPDGLEGPFDLAEVRHVFVEMSDGVEIEGWIGMPDLPEDVPAPVIVVSSPYLHTCYLAPLAGGPYCIGGPSEAGWWNDPPSSGPVSVDEASSTLGTAPIRLVERGFAVGYFAVRGMANSGGCHNWLSEREQSDQVELVEWLGSRGWSNGRVAMAGLSYDASTALGAAVNAPQALKTVVITGIMQDLYSFYATPQGAVDTLLVQVAPRFYAELSQYPDPFHPERLPGRIQPETERLCPELVRSTGTPMLMRHRDDRDAEFWSERRLIDRFEQITAASLLLPGFQELPRIGWQEDLLWEALTAAPKRQVGGQWGHEWPSHKAIRSSGPAPSHDPDPTWGYSFEGLLYDWYDYWLKGIGPIPDGLGTVDYEDDSGAWRRTASWPPPEAESEALYLAGESLAAAGEPGFRSYSTALNPLDYFRRDIAKYFTDIKHPDVGWWAALCPEDTIAVAGDPGIVYTTPATHEPVVIAGNPHAWLDLVSDQAGGVVDVRFVDLGPDFRCDPQGRPVDARHLAKGAADLRFHAGNFVAADFPVGTRTPVRIDFPSLAGRLEPGHRLALVLSAGEGYSRYTPEDYPTIQVVAGLEVDASHVVLPIVEGTLGGAPDPDVASPRPFGPGWSP